MSLHMDTEEIDGKKQNKTQQNLSCKALFCEL